MKIGLILVLFAGLALAQSSVPGPIPCAGNNPPPGVTFGAYLQECQSAAGLRFACNNVLGCKVAADWVSVGSAGSTPTTVGVAQWNGSSWAQSYTVGTAANDLVQLNGSGQLPAISGALLTNLPAGSVTVNGQTCGTCNVNTGAAAHSVALNEGSGSAIGSAIIGTAGRVLLDQGAGTDPVFEPMSQDCSITAAGVVTCLRSNNTLFGTAAFVNTGTSLGTVPLLNGANTWSATQAFAAITATTGNFSSGLTTNITGSTQCIHVNSAGLASGTGSDCGSGGSTAFSGLTSGTNSTAAMLVGTGASLGVSGSGTISATTVAGGATNDLVYQAGSGTTGFLAPVNNAVLSTNGSGVPSESTTLPTGLTIPAPASLNCTNCTAYPKATGSTFGTVEPDGTSISVSGGVISATGANAALSNLSSPEVNASIGAATGLTLGTASEPWLVLYLYPNGNYGTFDALINTTCAHAPCTWTVQDAVSDTFVGRNTTDTLTNKTLTSPVINGISGSALGSLCTGAQYSQGFSNGSNNCGTPAGSGNVSNTGTPVNHQIGIWASATTIGGEATATIDSSGNETINSVLTSTLKDANGNPFLLSSATASAVDSLTITNAAAANPATVTLAATGSDSNVSLAINPKGTGTVSIGGPSGDTGALGLAGNTTLPSLTANYFYLIAPNSTSFTAYGIQFPATGPSANNVLLLGALSGGVSQGTFGTVPNASLTNSATTVNSQTCTLGSSCTIPLSAINPETATYQVLAADFSNYKTITVASGTFTITLVASGSQPANGQYIHVINYGSGVVTIARSGQNINGGTASLTLGAGSATAPTTSDIYSDATNYFATAPPAAGGSGTVTSVTCGTGLSGGAITVSGTCAVTGGAGQILAGATPALTATPALGTDNSVAGTIQLSNGSAVAHTILGSVATTSNTVDFFATVPTTGDLIECVVSSTTCTLTDAGVLAANVTTNSSNFTSGDLVAANGNHTTTNATGHNVAIPLACADTSASGTAQVCNTTPTYTPAAGDCVIYTTTTANSGTGLTLNVNSLGAKSVAKWLAGTTLAANDVLANKEVPTCYDGTNWELATIGNAPAGGGGGALSAITAAAGSNTIANGNNPQVWNWAQTTNSQTAFTFGETTAATGTTDVELAVTTLATSTAIPLKITEGAGIATTGNAVPSALTVTGGAGGAVAATAAGNTGGPINLTTGAGSAGGATSGTGGAGGAVNVTAGNGGAATAGSTTGAGGNIVLTPGSAGGTGTAGIQGDLQIPCGTVGAATTTPCLSITDTWNTTGVVDAALLINVTNTASGAASKLLDLQIAGTTEFNVDKAGNAIAATSIATGTPPSCTAGTGGVVCLGEGTAPTTASAVDQIYADSTSHSFAAQVNGGGKALVDLVMPGAIRSTGLTGSVSTATLCAASAGACNQSGVYRAHIAIYQSGTACTSNATGGVSVQLSWTDGNGTAHSAQTIPVIGNSLGTTATGFITNGLMLWGATTLGPYASGDITIDTNGTVIQYATTFSQCSTTGTATYAASLAVTRIE